MDNTQMMSSYLLSVCTSVHLSVAVRLYVRLYRLFVSSQLVTRGGRGKERSGRKVWKEEDFKNLEKLASKE